MFEDFTKQEIAAIVGGLIAIAALAVWLAFAVVEFVVVNPADPLAKAGGLNPVQQRAADHK